MMRPVSWPVALAAALLLLGAPSRARPAQMDVVEGAFIIECESSKACESIANDVTAMGGVLRQTFQSDLFHGLSVQLPMRNNNTKTRQEKPDGNGAQGDALGASTRSDPDALVRRLRGIKSTWPVQVMSKSPETKTTRRNHARDAGSDFADNDGAKEEKQAQLDAETEAETEAEAEAKADAAAASPTDVRHHVMTQVDRLHQQGFTGKGIKIAVIDTGVDYEHPALGGCLGPGCRVVSAKDFTQDSELADCHVASNSQEIRGLDYVGHGTSVASIAAGHDAASGFVGVAPNASIMSYRVLACDTMSLYNDVVMAAWDQARTDEADIIVTSTGFQDMAWTDAATAMMASRIVAKGVPCVGGMGNDATKGLFNVLNPSVGQGVTAVNSVAAPSTAAQQGSGGVVVPMPPHAMSRFSAAGPSWHMDLKPQLVAPGDDIPTARANTKNEYRSSSGTSFSGPLVAGIFALLAEARGTRDPVLLNGLLMSTAQPMLTTTTTTDKNGPLPLSLARQGAGLVQAWDAVHATTLVEPSALLFNDSDNHPASLSLRISNQGNTTQRYTLTTVDAATIYTLDEHGFRASSDSIANQQARVSLRRGPVEIGALTVPAGQSAVVQVVASDPEGVDTARLPVWSGWIRVQESSGNNNNNKTLTVPYLGATGSLRSLSLFSAMQQPTSITSLDNASFGFRHYSDQVKPPHAKWTTSIPFTFSLAGKSSHLRLDVVPLDICSQSSASPEARASAKSPPSTTNFASHDCVPDSSLENVMPGVKSVAQIPINQISTNVFHGKWDGEIVLDGSRLSLSGRYKFVASTPSPNIDAADKDHWQKLESPVFNIIPTVRQDGQA